MSTDGKTQKRSNADHRCCCSERSDAAHVLEAGLESFPASDAPDWNLGRSVRNYCIGACLLDRDDPSKLLARTTLPLIEAACPLMGRTC